MPPFALPSIHDPDGDRSPIRWGFVWGTVVLLAVWTLNAVFATFGAIDLALGLNIGPAEKPWIETINFAEYEFSEVKAVLESATDFGTGWLWVYGALALSKVVKAGVIEKSAVDATKPAVPAVPETQVNVQKAGEVNA